jgi:hypothetical protein
MRTIKPFIIYTVAGAVFFVPAFAFAKETEVNTTTQQSSAFCDRIKDVEQKALGDVERITQKVLSESTQALTTLQAKWKVQDTATQKDRRDADASRFLEQKRSVKKFSKKQQEAAITFNATVEHNILERRKSADAEVNEYRTGVTTLLEKRKVQMNDIVTTYKNSTTKAVNTATASCKNKVRSTTVQKQFTAQMKTATDTFKKKYKDAGAIASQIETLAKKESAELEKITGESKQKLINAKEGFSISISQE